MLFFDLKLQIFLGKLCNDKEKKCKEAKELTYLRDIQK